MRIICNECSKSFNFTEIPKFCPYCGSDSLERNNKKQKERALKLITEYNNITTTYELLFNKCVTNILPKINIDATTPITIANKPLRKKFSVVNLNQHLNSFIK